jgi:hypothetical protein
VVRAYTTKEWVILARGIHGEKYDYSKVDYKDTYTDVEVICPESGHGSFLIQPKRHIGPRKKECPICKPSGRRVIDSSVFTEDARAVHGDKYDYSKVDYKNNSTKCEIICPDHGSFHLTYRSHIMRARRGCPICEAIRKAKKLSGTEQEIDYPDEKVVPQAHQEHVREMGEPFSGVPPIDLGWGKSEKDAFREYELACASVRVDPENTLNKCRKIAEIYVRHIHAEGISDSFSSSNKPPELGQLISNCLKEGLLDRRTQTILNSMQFSGNVASHYHPGEKLTFRDAKPVLLQVETLLSRWLEGFEAYDDY